MDSILKGITIIEGKQHVDHHTLVHHIEPNCEVIKIIKEFMMSVLQVFLTEK